MHVRRGHVSRLRFASPLILIEIFLRDIIFRHFVRPDFSLALVRLFHARQDFRFKSVALIKQLRNAFRIDIAPVRDALQISGTNTRTGFPARPIDGE